MGEQKHTLQMPHQLILEDRKKLVISGVQDVDCFDEQTVIVYTNMGRLVIHGQALHVNILDVSAGELTLEGDFSGLEYTEQEKQRWGFLSALFR